MVMKRLIVLFILLFLMGCGYTIVKDKGTEAGGSTYSRIKGELIIEYNKPYDQVWEATNRALKDLSIEVEESKKDQLTGKITAYLASGSKVVIDLKNKPSNITNVKIKIGRLGDKDTSYLIKNAIDRNLTTETPKP